MYKNYKFVAFIPARGGSKGIINKNMYLLGPAGTNEKKPLLWYTLNCAMNASYLDGIYVSTDSPEIAAYAKSVGGDKVTIVDRPKELSLDTSKTIEAMMHTVHAFPKEKHNFDYIVLLQPTSPLRQVFHIQQIIEQCVDKKQDNIVSVHKLKHNPILTRWKTGDVVSRVVNTCSTVRRQDMPDAFYVNGMLAVNKVSTLSLQTSINDNPFAYETDPFYSVDINTFEDVDKCEQLMAQPFPATVQR